MSRARPLRLERVLTVLACSLALTACAIVNRGHKVDVGGYRLRIQCAGHGSPTVVMDAGLGDTSASWTEVWPAVTKFTRACVYDRAGLGRSEPGPIPRTSRQIVGELRTLLGNAHVEGPFLLVGHSFGGMNLRLFAARYPDEVAGIVLVDATHEDFPSRETALRPVGERRQIENAFGIASPAAKSEFQSIAESAAQVRAAGDPPVNLPLIVLTAGRYEGSERMQKLWVELQADLARRSKRGRQILAEDSGHYIQFDQPDLVVGAIRELVEGARR